MPTTSDSRSDPGRAQSRQQGIYPAILSLEYGPSSCLPGPGVRLVWTLTPTWCPALAPQADSVTPMQPTHVPRAMLHHVCYTVSSRRLAPRLPSWLPSTSPAVGPPQTSTPQGRMGSGHDHWDSMDGGTLGPGGVQRDQAADQVGLCGSLKDGVTQACLLPSGWQKREAMARGGVQKLGLHRPLPGCLGWCCSRQTGCVSSGAGAWRVRVCACACARVCVCV